MLKFIVLISASLFSLSAFSACREAEAPGLQHLEDASEYEMLLAQSAVKQYLADQRLFLTRVQDDRRHNKAVDRMHEIANQYNRSARRFKAKMESLDRMTELAFLSVDI